MLWKSLSHVWLFATPGLQSMGFSRPEYWSAQPYPSPGDLPNPGIEARSPTLQAESLSAEPPGKPKNTGVGCHSFLQGIFPTQELNQGLLHCRQIRYQLSYQGSPYLEEGIQFNPQQMIMIYILKTMRHWWKKLKMTQTNGKIYFVLRLEESIWLNMVKMTILPRQSTDSMQSLSNYWWHILQN